MGFSKTQWNGELNTQEGNVLIYIQGVKMKVHLDNRGKGQVY